MRAGLQNERCVVGNCGEQIKARGMRGLVGRQGDALAMRQEADLDADSHALASIGFVATVLAICATSSAATCSFVMTGHESTVTSPPSRRIRCTVLRSPPITPVAGDTSL